MVAKEIYVKEDKMNELTLEELRIRARVFRDKQKVRYQLARSLGFSGAESTILQNQNEATIRRLAIEKGVVCQNE